MQTQADQTNSTQKGPSPGDRTCHLLAVGRLISQTSVYASMDPSSWVRFNDWHHSKLLLLRCSWRLKLCSCWVFGASGCDVTGGKWPGVGLYSLFIAAAFLPRYQRGDLVVVCNCVNVLPHEVPSASSVSSPNLCCLSSEKWYPPQIRIQCPCPGQPARKGSPVCPPWGASCIFSSIILLRSGQNTSPLSINCHM